MSSRRRLRRKACTGKRRYDTHEEAREHLRELVVKGKTRGFFLNVYPCRFCGGFHVGRQPRPNRKRRKRTDAKI